MILIKLFKTLLIVIPCLIIAVLVIIGLPEKQIIVIDEMGDPDAFDTPTYVTNSDMSFFYKKNQLSTYREQQQAEDPSYFKMSENIVTTDFTKNEVSILPDTDNSYTGSRSLIVHDGAVLEYTQKKGDSYILVGGQSVPAEESFEIILNHNILGKSENTPHRVDRGNTYYAAFTAEQESIYFVFAAGNEFASIKVGNLVGNIEYTLLDSKMNPIKNGLSNTKSEIEIQYKGTRADIYYLKLTGSFKDQITPFTVALPSDNNEWMWQMEYFDLNTETGGKFDYYGDEDFYVLPSSVTDNLNKSVMKFTQATANVNVVIYNKDKTVIGQYVYKPGETDIISMYGLDGAFAVSVYSHDGKSSGTEYKFTFEHTEITLLDIETYGFELSPSFSEDVDYYTSSVKSLSDKMITDVMYSPPSADIKITVKQQTSDTVYIVGLNEELPLAAGRNTVTITVTIGELSKQMVIVISDKTYDLSLTDFEYTETTMPESYKEKIEALSAAHPNWKFTFVKTGKDFSSYIKTQIGDPSIIYADGKWRQATESEIQYYVDPRNFLDEKSIFMFEKQIYSEGAYSTAGIKSVWNDDTFASYIMDAAESTGLSPYFIVARAGLESGYGKSALASGTVKGYEGYYNFYGIGAVDSNPSNGAVYAKEQNWNSKRRAIIEGAAWVKNQYIAKAQYTIYFMKYCFRPGVEWHQYMTDIAAPSKDAVNYYKAHVAGGTIDSEIEFVIPVFDNMP